MKFSAVIFDKDGVIIDTQPIHFRVFNEFCREFNWDIPSEQYETYIGITSIELFTRIKEIYNVQYSVMELVELFQNKYLHEIALLKNEKPIKGVDQLIKALYGQGIKLAIASSASRKKIKMVLQMFELEPYFDVIVSGFEVEKSKPFPDIFLRAAEQLGVPTSECVVIEDSTHGISAAKAANIFCIGYQNPMGKQNLSQADRIVDDFSELLKSDFIYGHKY